MQIRKNASLLLALTIPVLMIVLVGVSIYIPGLFIRPHVNFLYETGGSYSYYGAKLYSVEGDKLLQNMISTSSPAYPVTNQMQLFIHDVASNTNQEISYDEAKNLTLDPNLESSDGFIIQNGTSGGGFPFFDYYSGIDYNSHYLVGHNVSKKLNLQLDSGTYYGNFQFLAWIQ